MDPFFILNSLQDIVITSCISTGQDVNGGEILAEKLV